MCGEVGSKMVTCRYCNHCRNPLELEREERGKKKGRKEKENKIGRRKEGRREEREEERNTLLLEKGQMYLLDQGLLRETLRSRFTVPPED